MLTLDLVASVLIVTAAQWCTMDNKPSSEGDLFTVTIWRVVWEKKARLFEAWSDMSDVRGGRTKQRRMNRGGVVDSGGSIGWGE